MRPGSVSLESGVAEILAPRLDELDRLRTSTIAFQASGIEGIKNIRSSSRDEASSINIEFELDREKRRQLWHAQQHLYARDLPVLPLYFRADPFVMPKWLRGIEPTGHQYPTTLWIENWRYAAP